MDIAIIGAGIGGLAAAASLARQGHRVRVYEQAAELGEVGAAVQMSANAVKVLYALGLKPTLEARGVDVLPAMVRYAPALENYHRLTMPSTWLEALVKTYVGDAMAADLYLALAGSLPDEIADVVRAVLAETVHSQFVVAEVRAAVTSSGRQRSRLALWSRRLLGEAVTQAQFVLADHDELVDLVLTGSSGLGQMTDFFERMQRTHDERMRNLGLA